MGRILRLPDHGSVLICTDLQGCLRDYRTVVGHFHERVEARKGDVHLLFTGDLIHGPHIAEENWPDYLGEYYRDQSIELMEEFEILSKAFPGRIHALLGNHEHGHIGGPHTAKFAIDEVALLERSIGKAKSRWLSDLFRQLPLVAVTPCGAVLTHGAPAAVLENISEIENVALDASYWGSATDILEVPVIGPILWARSAPADVARRFADLLGGRFTIFGHDVVPSGFERLGDEQMVVSTSFGVTDDQKVFIELDLAAAYATVHQLELGREIRPLYPAKAPIERRAKPGRCQ